MSNYPPRSRRSMTCEIRLRNTRARERGTQGESAGHGIRALDAGMENRKLKRALWLENGRGKCRDHSGVPKE